MEKKKISISLSTFFLLLAIIAIGVMGYFIYRLNDEKTKATEQVNQLNNQVTTLQTTVDLLQENNKIIKNANTTSNSTNEVNTSNNSAANSNTNNAIVSNLSNSNKEVYKRVKIKNMSEAESKQYPEEYIVLDGNSIYFSSNLTNKILEGTYKTNGNTIDYSLLKETQEYAFYTSASYKFETIDGKKNIVVDNGQDGMMYFEKVD